MMDVTMCSRSLIRSMHSLTGTPSFLRTSTIVLFTSSGSRPTLIVRLAWLSRSIKRTRFPFAARATPRLCVVVVLEMELLSRASREKILDRALRPIRGEYDFILVDCPPQLSILTINALSCADGVIIPVKTDYLAYRGLTQLQDSIQEIQELINPELKVLGVIATLYEKRVGDDNEILAALKKEYNLLGVIKRLAVAKKGIYDGLAVVEQTPSSEISIEYNKIADIIIVTERFERVEKENG
mgnify:CR=1 FL=1